MDTLGYQRHRQLYFEDIQENEEVPEIWLEVSFKRVIQDAAATLDYFPGHHDPEYARAQGQKTIYLNTMCFHGFIDRVVTDWAGPYTFIVRRKMTMSASVYAGDTMYGKGRVLKKYVQDDRHFLDIAIEVGNESGVCCPSSITVELPKKTAEHK